MTPIAHALTQKMLDLDTPPDERQRLRDLLHEIHCFEVTAAIPICDLLSQNEEMWTADGWNETFAPKLFLPAPKTWLEMRHAKVGRIAYRCCEIDERIDVQRISDKGEATPLGSFSQCHVYKEKISHKMHFPTGELIGVSALLMIINSPRFIGRQQIMPHRGLERDLLRKQKLVGKFPLHAFTEIKLPVTKPPKIDDGKVHEAHLTGQQAKHFVRAHLCRLFGREWEIVWSRWQGNPALGIKQSRYVLQ